MKADLMVKGMKATMDSFAFGKVRVQITNDQKGKTLSIGDNTVQFTIPFEQIEKYLK